MTEDDLEMLFAAARDPAAQPLSLLPSSALTARVLADADAEMPAITAAATAVPRPIAVPRSPRRAGLWGLFGGGGGAFAGMVTATLAGFWIGFAQPVELGAMSALLTGASAEVDMMPGLDALLDEAP